MIGAPYDDGVLTNAGAAYVYETNQDGDPDTWTEVQKLTVSDADFAHLLGEKVAVSIDTIVLSATSDDDVGSNAGAAYVFLPSFFGAGDYSPLAFTGFLSRFRLN